MMAYTKVEIGYFVVSYDTIGVKTKVKKKRNTNGDILLHSCIQRITKIFYSQNLDDIIFLSVNCIFRDLSKG